MKDIMLLFFTFAKVGILGYGGGHSIVPLIQAEVVDGCRWLTIGEFTDALAMANALPGPITTKLSIVTGFKVAGISGALVSILGLILPSTILIFLMTAFYLKYKELPAVKGSLRGVRPAVIALLLVVIYNIFPASINSWHTGIIALVAFYLVAFLHLHPAVIIFGAALVGIAFYR